MTQYSPYTTVTVTRDPNSDIFIEWNTSPGPPSYANVIGSVDADYNWRTNTPGTDIYGFASPAIPEGAKDIIVTLRTRCWAYIAGSDRFNPLLYVGAALYYGAVQYPPMSYQNYDTVWATNPRTGLAWTVGDINGTGANPFTGIGNYATPIVGGIIKCSYVLLSISYYLPSQGFLSRLTGALSRIFRGRRQLAGGLTMSGALMVRTFEVRAMYIMGAYLYALVGKNLYTIDTAWAKTLLGSVGTTTGNAWIVGDGANLCVVDGVKGYSWNGATWAEITFPDTFAPSSLTFQDGYYIVSKSATGRFYISSLNNPTAWNALDYATAEGAHDNLIAVISHNRDLWLLGSQSIEFWYNSGAAAFPFERAASGGFINIGCKAARSVVSSEGNIFWLDNTLKVRMITGTQSEIISTPQIEYQISQLDQLEQAVGFYYYQKGHGFYQLSLGDAGANKTFVFDTTTKYWHTRTTGAQNRRHPAQCYAFFNKKHLVGHYSRGQILELDYTAYTNNGDPFTAIRAAQAIHADRKRIFHKQLEIEFESGVGVDASTDPEAILDWSDDGGHTWSNEHVATFGKLGEYTKRAIWRRLGNSRGRVYRVTINDPVKRVIIGANLEVELGRN